MSSDPRPEPDRTPVGLPSKLSSTRLSVMSRFYIWTSPKCPNMQQQTKVNKLVLLMVWLLVQHRKVLADLQGHQTRQTSTLNTTENSEKKKVKFV